MINLPTAVAPDSQMTLQLESIQSQEQDAPKGELNKHDETAVLEEELRELQRLVQSCRSVLGKIPAAKFCESACGVCMWTETGTAAYMIVHQLVHPMLGPVLWMQADERARAEEQERERADAATAAHNALRESEADRFKAAEAATEAFDAALQRKHVRVTVHLARAATKHRRPVLSMRD